MVELALQGLDEQVLRRLEARAARHGVSVEAEVAQILTSVLADPAPPFRRRIEAIRAATGASVGPPALDSARLIREERDATG